MNHGNALRKLNRSSSHRKALFRNLATSLVLHNRIETTVQKAKELKRVADKLVTLGKRDTLHARRQAMQFLQPINRQADGNAQKLTAVHKLFAEIAPRYEERNGGYTRVVRSRKRVGDRAQMAIIEFVEGSVQAKEKKKSRKVKRKDETSGESTKKASAAASKGAAKQKAASQKSSAEQTDEQSAE